MGHIIRNVGWRVVDFDAGVEWHAARDGVGVHGDGVCPDASGCLGKGSRQEGYGGKMVHNFIVATTGCCCWHLAIQVCRLTLQDNPSFFFFLFFFFSFLQCMAPEAHTCQPVILWYLLLAMSPPCTIQLVMASCAAISKSGWWVRILRLMMGLAAMCLLRCHCLFLPLSLWHPTT